MNPFEAYAKKALTTVPDRLIGPVKTRAEVRAIYSEIVADLRACRNAAVLSATLADRHAVITQIRAEMPFLWEGDGDFLGLEREIEMAFETVEAAEYFNRIRVEPECERGRIPA